MEEIDGQSDDLSSDDSMDQEEVSEDDDDDIDIAENDKEEEWTGFAQDTTIPESLEKVRNSSNQGVLVDKPAAGMHLLIPSQSSSLQ